MCICVYAFKSYPTFKRRHSMSMYIEISLGYHKCFLRMLNLTEKGWWVVRDLNS